MRFPTAASLSLLVIGCASRARPPELVALQKLRADPIVSASDHRVFDLLAAADDLLLRAEAEWDHGKRGPARRDALAGQVKMKTALTMIEIERLRARNADLDARLAIADDEEKRLTEDLAFATEQVSMLQRLRLAKTALADERKSLGAKMEEAKKQSATERQRLADQLAAEKRRADAIDGVRHAELALRAAETVDAPHNAKAKYSAATSMLQEAHREFEAGHWDEALARATLAKAESEEAAAAARPLYEAATAATNIRLRDRALESDATSLEGVNARLEREGDLQRLVLSLDNVFADGKAVPTPPRLRTLETIKDLLLKYPAYSVTVTGFVAGRGKTVDLDALALARANAIYWALVSRGVDARRMHVDGKSTVEPAAADAGAASGLHVSADRIELSILYHLAE